MGRQKMQAEADQEAEKNAELERLEEEFDRQEADRMLAPTSSEEVKDVEAYRQDIAVDVFRALVHGIRIEMKPDQQPGSFAERVMQVHAELMLKAEQAGIIPGKVEVA